MHNTSLQKLYSSLLVAIETRDLEAVEQYSKAIQRLIIN